MTFKGTGFCSNDRVDHECGNAHADDGTHKYNDDGVLFQTICWSPIWYQLKNSSRRSQIFSMARGGRLLSLCRWKSSGALSQDAAHENKDTWVAWAFLATEQHAVRREYFVWWMVFQGIPARYLRVRIVLPCYLTYCNRISGNHGRTTNTVLGTPKAFCSKCPGLARLKF